MSIERLNLNLASDASDLASDAQDMVTTLHDLTSINRRLIAALSDLTTSSRTFRNVPDHMKAWTSYDDKALNNAFELLDALDIDNNPDDIDHNDLLGLPTMQDDCAIFGCSCEVPRPVELPEGDYRLIDGGAWVELDDAAIRIISHVEGISISVYRNGHEYDNCVTEAWVCHDELRDD